MAQQLQVGKMYNLDIYPSQILGSKFENVTVTAIFDYKHASLFTDITALHAQVKAYVPGLPDSVADYQWCTLTHQDKSTTVIGIPYINLDTAEEVTSTNYEIIVKGSNPTQLNDIRAQLAAIGLTSISIRPITK